MGQFRIDRAGTLIMVAFEASVGSPRTILRRRIDDMVSARRSGERGLLGERWALVGSTLGPAVPQCRYCDASACRDPSPPTASRSPGSRFLGWAGRGAGGLGDMPAVGGLIASDQHGGCAQRLV